MNHIGYIDIENDTIVEYLEKVKKKIGICKILPAGRFQITNEGIQFGYLICSNKMGGDSTGIAAEYCKNCVLEQKNKYE